MKKDVRQAQNNCFVFKETPFTKDRCTDLHTPDMNKVKWVRKTATHGDAVRVFSHVFIIGQRDTRNR